DLHQLHQPADEIGYEAEGPRLPARTVDRQRLAGQRLGYEIRNDAPIIGTHPWAVGVEYTRHAHIDARQPEIIEAQGFSRALALVIAGSRAHGIDIAPIGFGLRVLVRIAIDLAGRSLQED